ncbi:MAG TPA: sugar phosphate nucleotidyltransferase [Candidatus Methylomirabilis sp.]|nr:sugar phosphate nucleotidyltransferase [Candidatus Methylomirabilis sp.]
MNIGALAVLPNDRAKGSMNRASIWGIVLAGGQGTRLRGLIREVYGEDRPKQFAVLSGARSLLRQTLDRASLLLSRERTLIVGMAGQMGYMAAELRHYQPRPHVLEQPHDRGTAGAVLLSAHWILAHDPDAVAVVLPSDHFVGDDAAFIDRVAAMAEAAERYPKRIVLLGAQPTDPETEYGWIEPTELIEGSGAPDLRGVHRFIEKPEPAAATRLFDSGGLWNTFVFAARAATIVDAGRECLPELHERLTRLSIFAGTEHEQWALRQGYALAPKANFSRDVLERCGEKLAVMRLSDIVPWHDLGTPRRVAQMFKETGIRPPWLAAVSRPA